MTRLGRAVGIGAIVIVTLAAALPAQAATKIDGTFDTLEPKGHSTSGSLVNLGNGWYAKDNLLVGRPDAAEPGSPVPSASNSVRLSETACSSYTTCTRTWGTLRTVLRTTPGRSVTVSLLAAPGHLSRSEVGAFAVAQDQPNLTVDPTLATSLPGSGTVDVGFRVISHGLQWRQLEWTMRTTSAYTLIVIAAGTGATLWVDDISLRCGP